MIRNNHRPLIRLARAVSIGMLFASGAAVAADAQMTADSPRPVAAQQPSAAVTALYDKENAAVANRNFAQFVAPGTAAFKKAITKELFTAACANISSNLKSGYTSQFSGEKVVQTSTVYIWNLTCKNGVKYLAVMGVTGGKVSAFLYQPPRPTAKVGV